MVASIIKDYRDVHHGHTPDLGHSHQLVTQKIPKLISLGLIRNRDDDDDARRRLFEMTKKGIEKFAKFEQCTVRGCSPKWAT